MAEIWKDNILDEITKGTLLVNTVEELFTKIRQEFGEFDVIVPCDTLLP